MARHRPFHERVAPHVAASKLTAAQLATKTGWSEKRVRRLLAGDTSFHVEDAEMLARVLGKTLADLCNGTANAS